MEESQAPPTAPPQFAFCHARRGDAAPVNHALFMDCFEVARRQPRAIFRAVFFATYYRAEVARQKSSVTPAYRLVMR